MKKKPIILLYIFLVFNIFYILNASAEENYTDADLSTEDFAPTTVESQAYLNHLNNLCKEKFKECIEKKHCFHYEIVNKTEDSKEDILDQFSTIVSEMESCLNSCFAVDINAHIQKEK